MKEILSELIPKTPTDIKEEWIEKVCPDGDCSKKFDFAKGNVGKHCPTCGEGYEED